jgi:hypothetical protein
MVVMDILMFIKLKFKKAKFIIILLFAFNSCSNYNIAEKSKITNFLLVPTPEEIQVIQSNPKNLIEYNSLVNRAYNGNSDAILIFLDLYLDANYNWDGSAAESYSFNLIKIIEKYGDFNFYKLIKNQEIIRKSDLKYAIFPSGDNGNPLDIYIKKFPYTYNFFWLSL